MMASDSSHLAPEITPIPETIPVLPVRSTVVFPMAIAQLALDQSRSVQAIDDVMRGDRMVVLLGFESDGAEIPATEDLPTIGTVANILQLARGPDGTLRLALQGVERIRILEYVSKDPYLVARVEALPDHQHTGVETEGLTRALIDQFTQLVQAAQELPNEMIAAVSGITDPRQVAYFVASSIPIEMAVRQELLELDSVDQKLKRLLELVQHELAVREVGRKIATETQKEMTKTQRDYLLREQLRAIQRELGEESGQPEVDNLRERIEQAGLPEEARTEAERELNRLATLSQASPEYGIITTYLEWMANLPWSKTSGGVIDVPRARQVLDEDHYGLEKIKDRIIEYLSVKKLRQERLVQEDVDDLAAQEEYSREPILCFVGPPGVGKTSLGQSIARAMGRRFIRMALGGIRDEAEVRGHRRTYIGALPGRIIQSIRRADSSDPVFMLDEIDKLTSDWRGDPSSALLEVLDPAQNHSFVDTYLGVPFDLSNVLFIATANNLDTIPAPLRDRMEIIQLSGYTEDEKVSIARTHLIRRQVRSNGLKDDEISFDTDALGAIVRGYTREAGVRNLERQIGAVTRKVASFIAEDRFESVHVTVELVEQYLGRPIFLDESNYRLGCPGVATGMAWTPTGGEVLYVEAVAMSSHDEKLILTGMLGDVMKESAQAALSFTRSNTHLLGIDPGAFDHKLIHVHVPAGAIPKDGPSAGVTMATAIASLITGRCVRSHLSMTGEITLTGRVLPVGGVKEKVLAAHRAGVRTIILPRQNQYDMEDLPQELRDELEIVLVDTADEVWDHALVPAEEPATAHSVVG